MEIWDVYDINRKLSNKTIKRNEKMIHDQYHLVVHVCIFNDNNQMLIQQRQPFKKGFSNMWDVTCGGSALVNESSQMAVHRELLEEVGINFNFENKRCSFTINFDHGFDDFYVVKYDVEIDKLVLQSDEVQSVKWASKQEIIELIDNNTFINYHKSIIDMCFDMLNQYGAHNK